MKIKNAIITTLTVIILLITVSILLFNILDIQLNFMTYHKAVDGEYTLSFKGSFGNVRKVKISKNSKKLCSLPFNASADIFSDSYEIRWDDVNFDGEQDLLLVCAIDEDGDVHYTALLSDSSENTFIYNESLSDLPNLTLDPESKTLFTSYTEKTFTEEQKPNTPDKYAEKKAIRKYEYLNGEPTATEERAITFYSETDYYCYSIYEYDEKHKELTYRDEKWFSRDKLSSYPLSWD